MNSNQDKSYNNYFETRYKYSFSQKNILDYKNWFLAQWNVINNQFNKLGIKSLSLDVSQTNILELGSGIGGFYQFVPDSKFTGLELDAKAVDFAKHYFPNAEFVNQSLEEYSGKTNFDYIFAFEVLEHVKTPHEVIKKMFDLLAPNGVFIGTSPFPFSRNVICDSTHEYVLHPLNWQRLFLQAGFTKVTCKPMSFVPFLWRIHPKLNVRLPFYINLPLWVSTTLIIAQK